MAIDYVEQLLSSIDIIAESKAKNQKYDSTIIGTIVDDSDKNNGHYIIESDNITFDAYSENTNYKKQDAVRVQIMNGDWSQKKFILGKYAQDDNSPVVYVSPLDTIFDMTGNLVEENIKMGLTANGTKEKICLWSTDLQNNKFADIQNNSIYDTMFLSAEIQCLLSGYEVKSGDYGLSIEMIVKGANNSEHYIKEFKSSEMFGNPYAFSIFSKQEKRFNIASLGTIEAISLYLYQKKNFNYLNESHELLPIPIPNLSNYSNILVTNIKLGFGCDLSKIDDNTVQLYTQDEKEYSEENKIPKTFYLLWYNKDNNNRYVGFSDGLSTQVEFEPGKLQQYDEIKYREISAQDNRLAAQKEKAPLDLLGLNTGAAKDDSEKYQRIICQQFSNDLIKYLVNYQISLKGAPELETIVANQKKNIQTSIGSMKQEYEIYYSQATQILSYLNKMYRIVKLDDQNVKKPSGTLPIDIKDNLLWAIATEGNLGWEILLLNLEKDLKVISDKIDKDFQNYKDTQLSFMPTFIRTIEKIRENISKFKNSLVFLENKTLTQQLIEYSKLFNNNKITKESFGEEYGTKDLSIYDNFYSIYWYKKAKEEEEIQDPLLGTGWIRLTEYDNHGLPFPVEKEKFYPKKPLSEESSIDFQPMAKDSETLKVVLFFNHNRYDSNEITLINTSHYIDEETIDMSKALSISHKKYSRDSYDLYDENNTIINSSESALTRIIEVAFKGVSKGNEALENAEIYWYAPTDQTMLIFDEEKLKNIFNIENIKEKNIHHIDGYKYFYKTLTNIDTNLTAREFYYSIKQQYNRALSNNTIRCSVFINEIEYTSEIRFIFSNSSKGSANNNLVIIPATSQQAIGTKNSLLLNITLYDYSGNEVKLRTGANGEPEDAKYTKVNWLTGVPSGITGFGPKYLEGTTDVLIGGEIKASGTPQSAIVDYGVLEVATSYKMNSNKLSDVRSYYPIAFCLDEENNSYYIEGASTIVYDSTGTNPSYFKGPYRLFNNQTSEEITDVTWEIIYFVDYNGKYIVKRNSESNFTLFSTYFDFINNSNGKTPTEENNTKYERSFNQSPQLSPEKKTLIPPNIYLQSNNSDNNFQCVVICHSSQDRAKVYWAQSLYFLQNKDNLVTLNNWDGQTQVDDKNNRILSAMLVAGRKSINNNFEGVILGDIGAETSTNDLNKGLGLYGYSDGAQTFGINSEGTAYLGIGKGRIEANGKYGIIKSSTWDGDVDVSGNISSGNVGMAISLNSGQIDAHDFVLTSEFINIDSPNGLLNIGNKTSYIKFNSKTENPQIDIKVTNFTIEAKDFKLDSTKALFQLGEKTTAEEVVSKYFYFSPDNFEISTDKLLVKTNKFILDSSKSTLILGDETQDLSYFSFKKNNQNQSILNIKTNHFNLSSSISNSEIIINSNPNENEYYFKISDTSANKSGEVSFHKTNGIIINAKSIAIGGKSLDKYIDNQIKNYNETEGQDPNFDQKVLDALINADTGIYKTTVNGKEVFGINATHIITGILADKTKNFQLNLETGECQAKNLSILAGNPDSSMFMLSTKDLNVGNESLVFFIGTQTNHFKFTSKGQMIIKAKNFSIDEAGNAKFAGVIDALSGSIGDIELIGKQPNNQGSYIRIVKRDPSDPSKGLGYTFLGCANGSLYNKYVLLAGPEQAKVGDSDTIYPLRITSSGILYADQAQIGGWKMLNLTEGSNRTDSTDPNKPGVGGFIWKNDQEWHSILYDGTFRNEKRRMILDPVRDVIFAIGVKDGHWLSDATPDFRYCNFGIRFDGGLIFDGITYKMNKDTQRLERVGNVEEQPIQTYVQDKATGDYIPINLKCQYTTIEDKNGKSIQVVSDIIYEKKII